MMESNEGSRVNEGTPVEQSGCLSGCFTKQALVFGIIVAAIVGIWTAIDEATTTKVPFEFTIDVNQGLVDILVLRGVGCDLSEYEVEIYDGTQDGISARNRIGRFDLGRGVQVDNVFCRYTIRGEIPEHRRYAVKIATYIGDPNILSKSVTWSGSEGETLEESFRWYNPRDGD